MGFVFTNAGGVNTLPVPFTIMIDEGITEANPAEGPIATVKFKCLWTDHYQLVQGLLGLWNGTPPRNIIYTLPYAYPPSPNLLCTSVSSIVGLGKPTPILTNFLNQTVGLPWIAPKRAIVTAVFTRPPYMPAAEGGFFKLSFGGGGDFLVVPDKTYFFGDGTPTGLPFGIFVPQAEITVTRYKMPFLPDQTVMPLLNCVNNAPFQIGWNVYPAQTLLFLIGNSEAEADVLGNITYTCEYKFMYNPLGWNNALYPDRTTGFAPVADGNGNPPHPGANFGVLP